MTMHAKAEFIRCVPGAMPGGLSRTRFFDGMLLAQSDLENEQHFWRMKRRLTNRALGDGVVWGLRLSWNDRHRAFHLSPGYALDCCGNDLVVECAAEVRGSELTELSRAVLDRLGASPALPTRRCPQVGPDAGQVEAGVVLQYVECPDAPRAVHEDACSTNVTRCEHSRVRETTRLLLVPPPCPRPQGGLDKLCQKLEALREHMTPEARELLFPPSLTGAPTTMPVSVVLRNPTSGAREPLVLEASAVTTEIATGTLATQSLNDSLVVPMEVRAHAGWVMYEGSAWFEDGNGDRVELDAVQAPFSLALGWTTELPQGAQIHARFKVTPLLGSQSPRQVELTLLTEQSKAADGVAQVSLSVETNLNEALGGELDAGCFAPLRTLIFQTTDPECLVKGLAMSALYGWLMSGLGRHVLANGEAETWTGSRVLAAWIYLVAWRLLFGASALSDEWARLSVMLQELFKDWCHDLVYPGPKCCEAHHGVYLGSVRLSPKGQIIAFDPWEYRRHVVTGPLLAHWGGQLGLASVDEIAARFARFVCCVAAKDTPKPEELVGQLAQLTYRTMQPAGVSETSVGVLGRLESGGVGVHYGSKENLDKLLDARDHVVDRWEQVGLPEFLAGVVRLSSESEAISASRYREVYSLRGTELHVVVPAERRIERPPVQEGGKAPAGIWAREVAKAAPTARQPMAEFIEGVVSTVPVTRLKLSGTRKNVTALMAALAEQRVESAADVLAREPERMLEEVAASSHAGDFTNEASMAKAVDDLYITSESLASATGEATLAHAEATNVPLTRAGLAAPELHAKVAEATTTLLKDKLSGDALKIIGRRVVTRRP